jgi:hypothetical protein
MGLPTDAAAAIGVVFTVAFVGIGLTWFCRGKDKTISLTNVQLILWTGVILGSYVGLAALKGGFLGNISTDLLALMGISAGSYVTAASTRAVQDKGTTIDQSLHHTKGLLSSESNPDQLSIPKLQVFFWTLVALLIYILVAAHNFQTGVASLPDPGSGLVALMGISHGAYLGNKFSDIPREGGQHVDQFSVSDSSGLLGQGLKNLQARDDLPSVVGIVRKGKLMDLTDSSLTIQADDIMLAFGDSAKLALLGKLAGSTT